MKHENIVSFYEWYETSNHLWLVVELCTGEMRSVKWIQGQKGGSTMALDVFTWCSSRCPYDVIVLQLFSTLYKSSAALSVWDFLWREKVSLYYVMDLVAILLPVAHSILVQQLTFASPFLEKFSMWMTYTIHCSEMCFVYKKNPLVEPYSCDFFFFFPGSLQCMCNLYTIIHQKWLSILCWIKMEWPKTLSGCVSPAKIIFIILGDTRYAINEMKWKDLMENCMA